MRRYRNTVLISVLLFIALIFSSCVPRVNLFTVEVVSEPNSISVILLNDIRQADFSASDVKKTPLVLSLKPKETVIVKVIDEEPTDESDEMHLFDSWADGSVANPRVITADSNKKFEIKTKKSVRLSITSNPKGLVQIEGSGFYPVDTVLTLVAPGGVSEYHFSHWKVNGIADYNHELTIKLDSPVKIEAVYEQEALRILKVETEPKGLEVTIDGKEVGSPYVAEVEDGASRTIGFVPQEKDLSNLVDGPDTRYSFKSWSDQDRTNPRNVVMKSDLSLVVVAGTEYLVQASTFPEGIATLKNSNWFAKGSSISFEAPVVSGYEFSHWEVNGELIDGRSLALIVDSPKRVTAHYEQNGYVFSVNTEPSGLEVRINGVTKISPASFSGTHGSSVTVEIPGPQMMDGSEFVPGFDTRYTFSKWSDSNTANPRTVLLEADMELFANLKTEYLVQTATYPEGIAEIHGTGWKVRGSSFSYESSDSIDYNFSHWEVNGERVDGMVIALETNSPMMIVAVYKSKEESTLEVLSDPSELVFNLNSGTYSSPKSFIFEKGTSVQISFPALQEKDVDAELVGNDTRYIFSKWADGSTTNAKTFELGADTGLKAIYTTEFLVEVSSEFARIDGSGWHKKGNVLNLTAPEVSGLRFTGWLVNGSTTEQNPIALTIDSPKKIVAVYEKIEETNKTLRVSTTPEGLLIKLDDKQAVSPFELVAEEGTSHSFSVTSPQEKDLSNLVTGTDVRYVFSSWNDGVTSVNRTVKLDSDFSFTANMNKELKVETATQPAGLVEISGSGWYSEGTNISLKASSVAGYNFLYWIINGVNAGDSTSIEYVLAVPISVKAVYNSIPAVSFENISIAKGDTLRLTLSDYASDKDGDSLEYTLLSGPGSVSKGIYTVDSSLINAGNYDISIRVTDGRGGSVTGMFTLTVAEENSAPTAPNTPFPVSGSVDQELSVTLSWESVDPDGDQLVFDVYFGTSSDPAKVATGISSGTWQTGELTEGTTYFWRVVARDTKEATAESSLWSFITRDSVPADGVDKVGPVYTGDVLLVSNESESGTSRAFTGTLSESFLPTSFTTAGNLEREAYMVNPEIPLPYEAFPENIASPSDTFELAGVGDTRSFWVLNFATNKYYQLTATLLYAGQHSEVWVESTDAITESKASELGSEFDNAIYPLVAEYFYTPSDVDGNGRVQILCFDIQDNFATTGAYVGGYFSSGDIFNISNSNRAEIFYIDTYPTMHYPKDKPVDVSKAYSTLAHEFQHMVNFNRNYIVEGGEPMPSWINEGLSMAAEHLYNGVLTRRISYYNSSTNIQNGHSLVYWGDNNDTLSNYALSYLFMQYIRAQVGTESVYKDILLDKNNGSGAITNALAKYGMVKTLGEVMTDFRLALHLKNPTGPYGFMDDSDFDGITERLYTGSAKELRGGSAIFKSISDSYTEPGDQGSTIQYAGISG